MLSSPPPERSRWAHDPGRSRPLLPPTLTQGQLNSFEQCPRRYQYQYIEQLGAPLDPERQARTDWGSQFHQLMQQYVLGLTLVPSTAITQTPQSPSQPSDPAMVQAVQSLVAAVPAFHNPKARYEAEHRRLWVGRWGDGQGGDEPWAAERAVSALVGVYDLLVLEPERAEILDWKTYPKPPNSQHLAQNWQTLLYPFVLVETSDYQPEQVSMTYWFVQPGQDPTAWQLDYTTPLHEQIRARLRGHLQHLQTLTRAFAQTGQDFPPVDAQQQHPLCGYCPFEQRCQQTQQRLGGTDLAPVVQQVADLPEIALEA